MLTSDSIVIDTTRLAREVSSRELSLQNVMNAVSIPYERNTFHCGGNDAFYTMQVFLALLIRRAEEEMPDDSDDDGYNRYNGRNARRWWIRRQCLCYIERDGLEGSSVEERCQEDDG